ncbi:hypothetical protein RMATCC62417_13640 [Rhizopus microsporus]|nr:hypothetical protein RMATCC62417_13640 [Rhizopus microsporus]
MCNSIPIQSEGWFHSVYNNGIQKQGSLPGSIIFHFFILLVHLVDSNKTHLTDMSETKVDDSKKTDIPTKREFHQVETSTYWLPKDEDEQLRLTGQHGIFKHIAGG